jgi:RNA polymerase sigma-70 factor, ECF subfamily
MGIPLRTLRARDDAEQPAALDFDGLFRACVGDVHAYALSLLGDRASAEDVTALAFERLYRARGRLDPRRGTARGLLFTIARNAALDELRSRARRGPVAGDPSLLGDARPDAALAQVERRALLIEALGELPLRERELVLLKFHGQLSNAELARVLGISESNAGTRLHRALRRLRDGCMQLEREAVA